MTQTKHQRRGGIRWFQFSLRRLFVLIAVAALICSYLARTEPERLEETAPSGAHKIVREIFRDRDGEPINHGQWILYDRDEHKLIQGHYRKGKADGWWTYWHPLPSGRRALSGACQQGQRQGRWTAWYATGRKQSQIAYVDGRPHGPARRWWPEGVLMERGEYKDGVREGPWTTFDRRGQKRTEGRYANGLREGEWIARSRQGVTTSTQRFVKGKKIRDVPAATLVAWRTALYSDDVVRQSQAGWALEALGPAADPIVAEALQCKRIDVRCRALIIASSRQTCIQWLPQFHRALEDDNAAIRLAAIDAVAEVGPQAFQTIPILIRLLPQADFLERGHLLMALASIDPRRIGDLASFLRDYVPWNPSPPRKGLGDAYFSRASRDALDTADVLNIRGRQFVPTLPGHLVQSLLLLLEGDDAALRAKSALALA